MSKEEIILNQLKALAENMSVQQLSNVYEHISVLISEKTQQVVSSISRAEIKKLNLLYNNAQENNSNHVIDLTLNISVNFHVYSELNNIPMREDIEQECVLEHSFLYNDKKNVNIDNIVDMKTILEENPQLKATMDEAKKNQKDFYEYANDLMDKYKINSRQIFNLIGEDYDDEEEENEDEDESIDMEIVGEWFADE